MQTLLYNKNKHASGKKIDDMLLQLRQLINEQSNHKSPKKILLTKQQPNKQPQPKNIQNLIEQSSKLIQRNKKSKTIKPSIRSKILAASQILKDQNQLIKSYIRDKIQSELFSSRIQDQRNNYQLEQQKQKIIRLKEIELQRQIQNRKRIIQNVKEFDRDSRVKVDVREIDSLIYKEEPDSSYLLNLNNGKKVVSNSNQIKNTNLFFQKNQHDNQQDDFNNNQSLKKKSSFNSRQKSFKSIKSKSQHLEAQFDDQFKEITEQPEGYQKFSHLQTTNPRAAGLNKVLQKYPHLVTIFYTFLKNQIKINSLDTAFKVIPKVLIDQIEALKQQNDDAQTNKFFWKCNKVKKSIKNSTINNKQMPTINSIAQKYRFKGFGINEQAKVQFQRKKISQRRINKMIGQSKNFHPKKCILTKNQLIYYEQKDKSKQSSSSMLQICLPQAIKKIQLQTQRLQVDKYSKQEGSFFSKKQIEIEIVNLQGKNRGIKFEKNYLQGEQLVYDLRKLMANKIYRQSCILKSCNNVYLYQFINNPASKKFQLSNEIIAPTTQTEQNNIFILSDLIASREQIQSLRINQANLLSAQIDEILIQSKKFQKLKTISISHVKLNNQSFLLFCKLINQLYGNSQLEICLKDTKLDDECFVSNVGPFTSLCSKVKSLDISDNKITSKTIHIIKNCLESVTTIIQKLNVSNCPIMDFMKINLLIKEARKLQILQAINCNFDFDLIKQSQFQRLFEFLKKCSPSFKRLNITKNGIISPTRFSVIERMWMLDSIQCIEIDFDYKKCLQPLKQHQNLKVQSQLNQQPINFLNIQIKKPY